MSGPRRITDLLGPQAPGLAELVRQSATQARLDSVLQEYLDRPLRDHIHVAGAQDGTLVLAADTPVWGHRIRYLAPTLLEHMRSQMPGLVQVRIVVRPLQQAPAQPASLRTKSAIPQSAAATLSQAAEDCANPALAEVLKRLAKRAR